MRSWRWAFVLVPGLVAVAIGACGLESAGQQTVTSDAGVDVGLDAVDDVFEAAPPTDGAAEADVVIDTGPLSPPEIPGVFMWLRADMKVQTSDAGLSDADVDGGDGGTNLVVSWDDSSGSADPARNATAPTLAAAPTFVASSPTFNNRPVLRFDDYKRLTTGIVAIVQPATVFLVGAAAPGGASNKYFLDSNTIGSQFAVLASPPAGDSIQFNAGALTLGASPSGTVPQSIVGVFAGSNSAFYVSSRTPRNTNAGSNGALALSIGNYADGTIYSNKGGIAELAVWKRSLTALEVQRLQAYAGSRYGIVVTP